MKDYGVYLHSSGQQGGYVVRTRHDGWCPSPYNHAEPMRVYAREHAAQAYADKLNANEQVWQAALTSTV